MPWGREFRYGNIGRHRLSAREITGISLVFLKFSAIPMRAAVAVCIILHFVLRSNGAGIRAPDLHLYWIDAENLHSHIRLALSTLLTNLYLALASAAWVCRRQKEFRRCAAKRASPAKRLAFPITVLDVLPFSCQATESRARRRR